MKFLMPVIILIFLSCTNNKKTPAGQRIYNDSVYQQFWTADWSADDKYIAVGGVDSILRIYHANDLELYRSFQMNNWIHSVKWNPKENILAIATLTDYVQLLDVPTSKFIKVNNSIGPNHLPDGNGSRGIGWNHTGEMLAIGGLDGIIKIWDKQGNLLKHAEKYDSTKDFISYVAFDWHPSKNIFVAANFEIQLYDSLCNEIKTMQHANKEALILCARWHPSGEFFVIGDYGHNWEGENVPSLLHFWSANGQLIKSVPGSKGEYRSIDWNPKGDLLATASDVLRIWNKDGTLLHQSEADGSNYLWGLSWNSDGTKIVTSSRHKTVAIWDNKAKLIKRIDVVD